MDLFSLEEIEILSKLSNKTLTKTEVAIQIKEIKDSLEKGNKKNEISFSNGEIE